MRQDIISLLSLILLLSHGAAQQRASPCRATGQLVLLRDVPEASGVALSRRTPGILWAHNDSGDPILFALDARGSMRSRVRLTGADMEDWEDIAVAPCPGGSCIYAADIGDNNATRKRITVYRVPEPDPADKSTAPAEPLHAVYPDGPRDAESLVVSSDGGIFIVSKGETGPVALYRLPNAARPGAASTLERVGRPQTTGKVADANRITGGAASHDDRWVALRSHDVLTLYPAPAFLKGTWPEGLRIDLRELDEPQGEGVAVGADGTVYLVGEGGARSGTFARFTCAAVVSGNR